MRASALAVPRVASSLKPMSWIWVAIPVAADLSRSATERKTVPASRQPRSGRRLRLGEGCREVPRDAHHLAGGAHLRAEQDIGPREAVEGQHRLLDAHVTGGDLVRQIQSASFSPSMIRQASLATGSPIALETNGTVRDARGLASITCSPSLPWIANCTFSRPTTPSALAIPVAWARISSSISPPSECGGSTQAESPEWIPASSTCCMIPAIHTSSPSHSASTSTSTESSRKRSR